jgi:hypothetical protein
MNSGPSYVDPSHECRRSSRSRPGGLSSNSIVHSYRRHTKGIRHRCPSNGIGYFLKKTYSCDRRFLRLECGTAIGTVAHSRRRWHVPADGTEGLAASVNDPKARHSRPRQRPKPCDAARYTARCGAVAPQCRSGTRGRFAAIGRSRRFPLAIFGARAEARECLRFSRSHKSVR